MVSYFFDTSALIEIVKENPHFEPYKRNVGIILTRLNLMELYYFYLRERNPLEGKKAYTKLLNFTAPYSNDTIQRAVEFRFQHKNKKFSYVDCIGYMIAKERSIKFLTSDSGFKGMDNVEFVEQLK